MESPLVASMCDSGFSLVPCQVQKRGVEVESPLVAPHVERSAKSKGGLSRREKSESPPSASSTRALFVWHACSPSFMFHVLSMTGCVFGCD